MTLLAVVLAAICPTTFITGDEFLWKPEMLVKITVQMSASDWENLGEQNTECWDVLGDRICHKPFFCTKSVKAFEYTEVQANCTTSIGNITTVARACAVKKRSHCGSNSWHHPALTIKSTNHGTKLFGSRKKFTLANAVQDPSFLRIPLGFWASCLLGIPSPRFQFAEVEVSDGPTQIYTNRYISLEEPDEKIFQINNFGTHEGALFEFDLTGSMLQGNYLNLKSKNLGALLEAQLLEVNATLTEVLSSYNSHGGTSCVETACSKQGSFLDQLGFVDTTCDYAKGIGTRTCMDPPLVSGSLQQIARWIDIDQLLSLLAMELVLGHCDGLMASQNNAYAFFANLPDDSNHSAFRFVPWGIDQILNGATAGGNKECVRGPKQLLQKVFDREHGSVIVRALFHSPLVFKAFVCKAQESAETIISDDTLTDMLKQLQSIFAGMEGPNFGKTLDGDMDGLDKLEIARLKLLQDMHHHQAQLSSYIATLATQLGATPQVCESALQDVRALNTEFNAQSFGHRWCTTPIRTPPTPKGQKGYIMAFCVIVGLAVLVLVIRRQYNASVIAASGSAQPKPGTLVIEVAKPRGSVRAQGLEPISRNSQLDMFQISPLSASRRMSVNEAAAIIEGRAAATV
jgi:hypothetical protein